MNELFDSKSIMMGAYCELVESLVMLNRKIVWQDDGISYTPSTSYCERVVEAPNLQNAKTVVTSAVRESDKVDREGIREYS